MFLIPGTNLEVTRMAQKTATRESVTQHLTLKPVPPFDFDLSATIFSRGDPRFRFYEDGKFKQAVSIDGTPAILTVTSAGTVEEPVVKVELKPRRELSRHELEEARRLITRMFNLDMDLRPFYKATKSDPVMTRLVKNLYGLKSPITPTVFEALVDSIIEQQISLIAAQSMENKLIRKYGEKVKAAGETMYLYPTPERLAAASIADLRTCGLSGRKAEYIKSIARMLASGELDLDKFDGYDDIDEIREELKAIRGIGDWTAEMTMIRGLHKMDSIPADDVGLQAKMTHYYGKDGRATREDLNRVAQHWGKYRGLGGFYMIVAHHVGVEPTVSWPEFWGKGGRKTASKAAQGKRAPSRKKASGKPE
jgi:DNA-3-methyladenine glycosylase II